MRNRVIWSAFSIAAGTFVLWAASFGAPVHADTPECEAVFSVICEEGYEKDVEILLTDEETGETVATAVGAGDGFAVGILSAWLEGLQMPEMVDRGNAIGSIQVSVASDNEGLPTKEELDAYMKGAK